PEAPKLGLTGVTITLVGLVAIAAALWWIYATVRRPTPPRLLLSFLLAALVISAIPTVAFGRPSLIDSEGERYAYMPSIFASMIVGLTATVLVKARAIRLALAAAVVVFLATFLEISNQNWRIAGELTASVLAAVAAEPAPGEMTVL